VSVAAARPAVFAFTCTRCQGAVGLPDRPTSEPVRCPACEQQFTWDDGVLLLGTPTDPDDYPEALHALLASVEPRHFWFAERNRLILATMRQVLGGLDGRSVLDVGCGTGFVVGALERAGMRTCGLDMNLIGLRFARHRMRGPLICETAARVPFVEQFDVAMLCDVIEHTPDDLAVLEQTRQALVAGGSVVVTVPAHPQLWTPVDDASGHKRRYTRRTLVEALERAGFEVQRVRYFNGLLIPVQALQRWALKRRAIRTERERNDLVAAAIRVPPPLVNTLLGLAMAADGPLGRLPWTFGTSLIAIGRTA